ncbi:MAG: hypothetical protein AAGA77_13850 [Bacteroidota bacterium]
MTQLLNQTLNTFKTRNFHISLWFFAFLLIGSLSSCGGDDDPDEMEEEFTIFTNCQYSLDLNGETINREVSFSSSGITCNVLRGDAGSGTGFGATLFSNSFDSEEELVFFRGTINGLTNFEIPTQAQFDALFLIGNIEYTEDGDAGIQISYVGPEGRRWSTDLGAADQTGSEFEILERVADTFQNAYVINLRVRFKCMLYNGTGDSLPCEGTATFKVEAF